MATRTVASPKARPTPKTDEREASTIFGGGGLFGVGGRAGSDAEARAVSAEFDVGGAGRAYANFTGFPFPLAPFTQRRTVRRQVSGAMWVFEQEQGIGLGLGVSNLTRMTVVRLRSGGLLVHAPIAPTRECVALLRGLGGDVEALVLPTTLYEHKIFLAPFARRFPAAAVYVVPEQFSFPVDLPLEFFGVFGAKTLTEDSTGTPWEGEVEVKLLRPPSLVLGLYKYCEAALYVKSDRTLLITDAAVYVDDEAPEVIPETMIETTGLNNNLLIGTLRAIDYGGTFQRMFDREVAAVDDTDSREDVLRRGWRRICLFALYIAPAGESILTPDAAFGKVSGRWLVGPIVWSLVFKNVAPYVGEWAARVCEWPFTRVIPAHFAGPVRTTPAEFARAFDFTEAGGPSGGRGVRRARDSLGGVLKRLGIEDRLSGRYQDKRVQRFTSLRLVFPTREP